MELFIIWALLNFANTYAEISDNLSLPESASGE